jgi:hypothetical protein
LIYSTYLGGTGGDAGNAIAVDGNGNAMIVGHTTSPDFPLVNGIGATAPGSTNLFLSKVNPLGSAILYSTYLGGNGEETPCGLNMGIATDAVGSAYVAAATASEDFPVTAEAAQTALAGGFDAFVVEVRSEPEVHLRLRPEGSGTRLVVTLGNPGSASREVELKFWVESPALGELPFSLVTAPLVFSVPPMPTTEVIDVALPSELRFPGTTLGVKLLEPGTGLLLDESVCASSPCE